MKLFKAFCKHLCPSETCPYKRELAKGIALPKPKEKEEATPPLPAPNKGVNESHDKVELGWSFDDVVKRAFLMLEKRYENMVTKDRHQSIQVRIEYDLDRTDKNEESWNPRKELYIFRYYDTGMSASERFKSTDNEETMREKWRELIHRIDYFDKDFRKEY